MTKDARAHRVGCADVVGQWLFDDGHDSYSRWGDKYRGRTAAAVKRWAGHHIPVQPSRQPEGQWWIRVERGSWVDASFFDEEYGHVTDVEWVRDDGWDLIGYVTTSRDGTPTISWEQW